MTVNVSWATATAGEARMEPPVPRPEASLAAMDVAAQTEGSTRQISSARIDCPRKWVEITLISASGAPIAGAACTLDVPGGGGAQATTNASGVATFEGVSIDPAVATLDVALEETGETTSYLIRVVPLPARKSAAPTELEEDEDEPAFFEIPWKLE